MGTAGRLDPTELFTVHIHIEARVYADAVRAMGPPESLAAGVSMVRVTRPSTDSPAVAWTFEVAGSRCSELLRSTVIWLSTLLQQLEYRSSITEYEIAANGLGLYVELSQTGERDNANSGEIQ